MSQRLTGETMAATMREHLAEDDVVEVVCHCIRTGTLEDGEEEWHRYDSLASLPERELGGWEELVVFTPDRVYRAVGVGYGGEVRVTPRTPDLLVGEAAATSAVSATADDD